MYLGAVADVISLLKAGDTSYFFRLWYEILYMGGSWIKNPYVNVLAIIDPDTMKTIYAEYHPTLAETGFPGNATAPVPDIFLGNSPESVDFLQEQVSIYSNAGRTGVLGDVVNCNGSFLVVLGPLMSSKTDTKAAGYILWGIEFGARQESFSRSKK